MRLILAVLAAVLLCGCLGDQDGGPGEISLNLTQDPYAVPSTLRPPATALPKPTTTEPTTTLPSTTTSATTTTSPTTTTTLQRRPWPTMTVTTSTTSSSTTTSTTTTIACSGECADVRIPSPRTCAAACCISSNTRCIYKTSLRAGSVCRCQ